MYVSPYLHLIQIDYTINVYYKKMIYENPKMNIISDFLIFYEYYAHTSKCDKLFDVWRIFYMKKNLCLKKPLLTVFALMLVTFILNGCGKFILEEPELEYDGTRTIISNVGESQYQISATSIDWISNSDGTYIPLIRLIFENSTPKDLTFAVYGTELNGESLGCSEEITVQTAGEKYKINTAEVTINLAPKGVSSIPTEDNSMTFVISIFVGNDTQASQTITLSYTPNNEYVIFEII